MHISIAGLSLPLLFKWICSSSARQFLLSATSRKAIAATNHGTRNVGKLSVMDLYGLSAIISLWWPHHGYGKPHLFVSSRRNSFLLFKESVPFKFGNEIMNHKWRPIDWYHFWPLLNLASTFLRISHTCIECKLEILMSVGEWSVHCKRVITVLSKSEISIRGNLLAMYHF